MQTISVNIGEVKLNPNNPRIIKDEKFKQLVKSIKEFPEMLNIRPIVVNDDMITLGGNMRLKACKEAGLKKVPVIKASDLTPEQQREFIIKDNIGYGEWDWAMLANDWGNEDLAEWGLDVPEFADTDLINDYSDKNSEINIDSLDGDMYIKLTYSEDDYWKVKEQLSKIASTPEQAVWKLLGNE